MKHTQHLEIFLAQKGRCFYCGKPMTTIQGQGPTHYTVDHFRPKCRGHKTNNNTVLAHHLCNMEKGAREPTASEKARFKELYRRIRERAAEIRKYTKENWAA